MITHNGTYLLHATHHGMPIYAATMGGKMILDSKWLLSATLQAIVAAFGAEGTEVILKTNDYLNRIAASDKAKATALAGFINQYPMIVGGLVDTGNKRVVMTTQNGTSVFVTDIVPNNTTDELYFTYKVLNSTSETDSILGYETIWSSDQNSFNCGPTSGNGTFWYHNAGGFKNTGTTVASKVGDWVTQFLTTKKCGLIGIDEFTLGNGSVNWNDNNKTVKVGIGVRIACFEGLMRRDGANLCRLIPAADNIMFDAERLVTIQNTGTGTSKVEVIEYPTPPTP